MTTKEKVLEILTKNLGSCVSGEALAQECGVSRAAIWKAVKSLRDNNCNIEGTTNGGYILQGSPDFFSKELLQNELQTAYSLFGNTHIEVFKEIDSTNTYAKKILSECGNLRDQNGDLTEAGKKFHNAIIVAESQTAGRGRLGRTFISPDRTGIYLSVIYAPKGGIKNPANITAFSAVAICRVLKKLYHLQAQIKWINDIFINGKKISGILTEGFTNFETLTIESAIIGIGVNISDNPQVFPDDIAKIAGSISSSTTTKISRAQLAAHIAGEVLSILEEDSQKLIDEYKSLSFLLGQTVTVHPVIGDDKTSYNAKVVDIDSNASLIVELSDGTTKALNSGEVSLHSDTLI